MKFCISFLNDQNPKIMIFAAGKDRTSFNIARKIIIDGYRMPFSIFTKLDSIDAFFIIVLVNE
jgi:hypothetical protein